MDGRRLGAVIGAVFGLVYVLVNAGPLPAVAGPVVRVGGAIAFLVVLAAVLRGGRGRATPQTGRGFGRGYWLIVAAEAAALAAGLVVLNAVLHTPRAGVGWVSLVVGAHFFALAVVFRERFFHVLGGAIAACGAAALVLVGVGAAQVPVATVGGIVPGALLLGFAGWGALRPPPDPPTPT